MRCPKSTKLQRTVKGSTYPVTRYLLHWNKPLAVCRLSPRTAVRSHLRSRSCEMHSELRVCGYCNTALAATHVTLTCRIVMCRTVLHTRAHTIMTLPRVGIVLPQSTKSGFAKSTCMQAGVTCTGL